MSTNAIKTNMSTKAANAAKPIKVAFAGDTGVGKTVFVRRLLTGRFQATHYPTIGVEVHPMRFDAIVAGAITAASFNLWDIAGGNKFAGNRDCHLADSDAAIVMFSVDNPHSFKNVSFWIKRIRRVCDDIPIVICANKVDDKCRVVMPEEIQRAFLDEIVVDTSAKTGYNLHSPLFRIIYELDAASAAAAAAATAADAVPVPAMPATPAAPTDADVSIIHRIIEENTAGARVDAEERGDAEKRATTAATASKLSAEKRIAVLATLLGDIAEESTSTDAEAKRYLIALIAKHVNLAADSPFTLNEMIDAGIQWLDSKHGTTAADAPATGTAVDAPAAKAEAKATTGTAVDGSATELAAKAEATVDAADTADAPAAKAEAKAAADAADASATDTTAADAAETMRDRAKWEAIHHADSVRTLASMRVFIRQVVKLLDSAQAFKYPTGRRQAIIDLSIAEIGSLLDRATQLANMYGEEYE